MLTITNLTKKYGKTILLSTHLLDVAQTIADCYKIIRNGVIAAEPDNSGDILSIYLESGKIF